MSLFRNLIVILLLPLCLNSPLGRDLHAQTLSCGSASMLSPKINIKNDILLKKFRQTNQDTSNSIEQKKVQDFLTQITAKNYYQILGIDAAASAKQIKKSFRDIVSIWHPDKNNELFRQEYTEITKYLINAYDSLKNEKTRANYDNYLKNKHSGSNQGGFWQSSKNKTAQDFWQQSDEDFDFTFWEQYRYKPEDDRSSSFKNKNFYDKNYVPPLSKIIEDLESEDLSVRLQAFRNLGKTPKNDEDNDAPETIQTISLLNQKLANDPASSIRTHAAAELYNLATERRLRSAIMPLVKNVSHPNTMTFTVNQGYVRSLLEDKDPKIKGWALETVQIFYSNTDDEKAKKILKEIISELGLSLSETPLLEPATSISKLIDHSIWQKLNSRIKHHNLVTIVSNVDRLLYEAPKIILARQVSSASSINTVFLFVDNKGEIFAIVDNIKQIKNNDGKTIFSGVNWAEKYIHTQPGDSVIAVGINIGQAAFREKKLKIYTESDNPKFNMNNAPEVVRKNLSDSVDIFQLTADHANGQGDIFEQTKKTWEKVKQELISSVEIKSDFLLSQTSLLDSSI